MLDDYHQRHGKDDFCLSRWRVEMEPLWRHHPALRFWVSILWGRIYMLDILWQFLLYFPLPLPPHPFLPFRQIFCSGNTPFWKRREVVAGSLALGITERPYFSLWLSSQMFDYYGARVTLLLGKPRKIRRGSNYITSPPPSSCSLATGKQKIWRKDLDWDWFKIISCYPIIVGTCYRNQVDFWE